MHHSCPEAIGFCILWGQAMLLRQWRGNKGFGAAASPPDDGTHALMRPAEAITEGVPGLSQIGTLALLQHSGSVVMHLSSCCLWQVSDVRGQYLRMCVFCGLCGPVRTLYLLWPIDNYLHPECSSNAGLLHDHYPSLGYRPVLGCSHGLVWFQSEAGVELLVYVRLAFGADKAAITSHVLFCFIWFKPLVQGMISCSTSACFHE